MTNPSEAEVEAAARAYVAFLGRCPPINEANVDEFRKGAIRAALTAAAQVRERAETSEMDRQTQKITQMESGFIEIEKMLCGLLGRPWRPSGMSVETLVEDLRRRLVQAPTEPAEASRDHPDKDIKVQCKCGWIGRQSELHWPASPSTAYFCPRCHKSFSSWTLAERSITSPDGTVFLYHEPYT